LDHTQPCSSLSLLQHCKPAHTGYGRKEVAEQLLSAGADVLAVNKADQKPIDAARCNNEKGMVQFLESKMQQ